MKTHTNDFKNELKNMGRQIDSIITYTQNGSTVTLHDELYSVSIHYDGNLLKSVMKQLDVQCSIEIPLETVINYQFGVKVGNSYEYINYGNFVVYNVEKLEDKDKYQITCYDKMLYAMQKYTNLGAIYPITIKNFIIAIANKIGLQFNNTNFKNYDREIASDLYNGLDYTYRDILDEIAQATGSIICINNDDELEIRYLTNTNDIIDEEYLKDVNVKFGEKYGPINSIVLSRAAESDNVYLRDEDSIALNGLCELKIKDNQIMNWNDRSDYLEDLMEALGGIYFYVNDFSSPGILYYELGDIYDIKVGSIYYKSIMLNDEINITSGIEEIVYTETLEQSETDYTKADKTDRRLNEAYIIVDKQNRQINQVISEIGDRDGKGTSITEDIEQLTTTVDGITNQMIQKGGNNLFYYGKEFWKGEEITTTVRRPIQVGDDLSNKKIYLSFPTESPVDIIDYNTGNVVEGENGNIYHYKREGYAEESVSVEYGVNEDILYEMEASSYIDGVTEYIMPNNFGVVTQVNYQSGVYEYIQIDVEETKEVLNIEEISGGEFIVNTVSGRGYIVNSGSSKQDTNNNEVAVPNGTYTVSFLYKKIGPELANGSVKINDIEYQLTQNEWTKFEQVVEVSTNHIEIELIADTDNTLYVADLLGNIGIVAEIWTQNPNETRTDTVKIGKGIEVISSSQDTKLKADADGVRVVQVSNENNIVTEFTKEGTRIKKLIAENQAQITGILIQQVGDQTWISSLL